MVPCHLFAAVFLAPHMIVLPTFLGAGDLTTFMPSPPLQLKTLMIAPFDRFQLPVGEAALAV